MTRKCARPIQELECCTGSENPDVIRGFKAPSDTQDKKEIHAISIAYTSISIRIAAFCRGYKSLTQRLNATSAPSSHQQAFTVRPQLSGLEAVGYHLPMLAVNSNLIMLKLYTQLPRDLIMSSKQISNHMQAHDHSASPASQSNEALQNRLPPVLVLRTYIYNE